MMSLAALSVMVVILATGCAATKNNIHMDANGYSNTGWQFGTPTIDTHTPGMNFRKPVMMPVLAGYQNQPTQPAPQRPVQHQVPSQQGTFQGVQQGRMVLPDVSGICPTCGDMNVASPEWKYPAHVVQQPVPQPAPSFQPQRVVYYNNDPSWYGNVCVGGSFGSPWGYTGSRNSDRFGGSGRGTMGSNWGS